MADQDTYDKLAKVLRDIHERFPDDGFSHHKRLKALLSDHLPEAEREVRIVLDAIDEGLVGVLTETPKTELDMQIDRLVTRLESSRGIREDIARQVIQAFTYALDLGVLPSSIISKPIKPASAPPDDWHGVSEVVQPPSTESGDWEGLSEVAQPPPTDTPSQRTKMEAEHSSVNKPNKENKRNLIIGAVVGLALVGYFNTKDVTPPNNDQQPPVQPQPVPQPKPQPVKPKPVPQPKPPPVTPRPPQNSGQETWYGPYGGNWSISFVNDLFKGSAWVNGQQFTMEGRWDQQTPKIYYNLYDVSGRQVGTGQGIYTNETHISFTSFDLNGTIIGQGVFHVNHTPS